MTVTTELLNLTAGLHPARLIPWDELYSGLESEVQAGNVRKVTTHGGLALYSYTAQCQFKNKWNRFSLLARGLILSERDQTVVATPFPKFFNLREVEEIPDLPFTVTEKFDGSLGIVYYANSGGTGPRWNVTTRGVFGSHQAEWAQFTLNLHYEKLGVLDKGTTYLVEIIYPENRVVIDYENMKSLVLIGAYDQSGRELTQGELGNVASEFLGFQLVREWTFDYVEDIAEEAKHLPVNREGYVVRFSNGQRVKIKGDEYCRLHKLISGITPLRIWELMVSGDDMEEARRALPFDLRKDFDNIRAIFQKKFYEILDTAEMHHKANIDKSDAELGKILKSANNDLASKLTFPCRKFDLLNEAFVGNSRSRKMVFSYLKPRGNILPGYVATNRMNRVQETTL